MTSREAAVKYAETIAILTSRMQEAASKIPSLEQVDWGMAEQLRDSLKYTVHAAHAMGAISENEAADLGFPV